MSKKTRETKVLCKETGLLEEQVMEANEETYTNIICYLRGASISEYNQEVVRRDILDMVLDAQSRGESVEELIGGDPKTFCDDVIASLPPMTMKERVMQAVDILSIALGTLFGIFIITGFTENLMDGAQNKLLLPVTNGVLIAAVCIIAASLGIIFYVTKTSFKQESKKESFGLTAGILGFMIIFIVVANFLNTTLFTIHLTVALLLVAVLFAVHLICDRLS